MNKSELESQNELKQNKPYVYDKVAKNSMRIVRIEYSYICNMKCKHCVIRDMPKTGRRVMTVEDVKDIAKQADELGFSQFVITGGEPTMFKELDQIIEAINPNKFYITIDSNGWLLDNKTASHWKDIGVDKVQVSIDNLSPKVHDAFRGLDGAFRRASKAINACQDAGLKVIVQTVVDHNRVRSQELKDFIYYFNEMRGVPVCVLYAKPVGAWKGRYDLIVNQDDLDYIAELEKKHDLFSHLTPAYDWPGGCIAVKRMINITRYGDVNPCPVMQELSLGNVFSEPLADIVSRGMDRFKELIPYCIMAMDKDFVERIYKTDGRL